MKVSFRYVKVCLRYLKKTEKVIEKNEWKNPFVNSDGVSDFSGVRGIHKRVLNFIFFAF